MIHQAFASPDQPGGTRHYELARHCVERGHRFTIVASTISYQTGRRAVEGRSLITEQNLDGVRVLRVYTYPSLHRGYVWRVVSFFSFMVTSVLAALRAGPVDLVMGTSPPIFQAVSAWLVAALRYRPFLLEIRDLWPEFAIDIGILTNPLLIAVSRWLERFLYNRATHLLVNSPAYRDYLIGKGVPASKIALIPNGADLDMFDPSACGEGLRRRWGLNGKFVVTYAGALGLANDIPTILRTADRLRERLPIHFLLVGDGKERLNLEALARQLDLPNVTFTGSLPKSAIPEVLAASDACIATLKDIPTFRTTYPNKVFDYMAAGRPVVLVIDGVIRDVVEGSGSGVFVPPNNPPALAAALIELAGNREKCRAMGMSGRATVMSRFNRNIQAEEFCTFIIQLADLGRNR